MGVNDSPDNLLTRRIGIAFSGGSVRGLAHIGVVKALEGLGVRPGVVAGTSAGSLVGAMLAAGFGWERMAEIARSVFWPHLLNANWLTEFCEANLPLDFGGLALPFAAVATDVDARQPVTFTSGRLAPALSASCAMQVVRRPVHHEGRRLKDGGITCVLPARACHDLGAEVVIASDTWQWSGIGRMLGIAATGRHARLFYPRHFRDAVERADLIVQPRVPFSGYVPGPGAVDRMIAFGERAVLELWERREWGSGGVEE